MVKKLEIGAIVILIIFSVIVLLYASQNGIDRTAGLRDVLTEQAATSP